MVSDNLKVLVKIICFVGIWIEVVVLRRMETEGEESFVDIQYVASFHLNCIRKCSRALLTILGLNGFRHSTCLPNPELIHSLLQSFERNVKPLVPWLSGRENLTTSP